jgi:hypothetical protein
MLLDNAPGACSLESEVIAGWTSAGDQFAISHNKAAQTK